jgi:hypothetical protein
LTAERVAGIGVMTDDDATNNDDAPQNQSSSVEGQLVGGKAGTSKNNLGNFLLPNPDLFGGGVSGPAQKAVLVPFFGVIFMTLFFNFFSSPGDFSGGV